MPAPTLRTAAEHRRLALQLCPPLPPRQVPLAGAHGLVLAADVVASTHTPPFDNSAMDGFAVRHTDVAGADAQAPTTLVVVGDVAAGSADDPPLRPGTAVRIMTGAPLPSGADAVVPIEHTDVPAGPGALPASVQVTVAAAPGAHVRRAGEDVRVGDTVLRAGTELTARAVAAAASAGRADVEVHPRPVVGILSTGSELVAPGSPLLRGQIPDSNSYLLAAAVEEAGGTAVRLGAVPDDADSFAAALRQLATDVDMIVTSGGVSVGAFDVVREVLTAAGSVEFAPVAMQPGKPQGLGTWQGTPVLALPGNPVSAFVSFEVFVRPALRRLAGHADVLRHTAVHTVGTAWRSPAGREQYMPVRLVPPTDSERPDDGAAGTTGTTGATGTAAVVVPATARGSGSHLVASLALADGLAVVPADVTEVAEGDELVVVLLR